VREIFMSESPSALQRFQMIVLEDVSLQQELRRCPDRPGFVTLVLERARERGCAIAKEEVEAALDAAAQAWIMRWVRQ
jgi:hypothetical protein